MKKISIIIFLMIISLSFSFAQNSTAQARGERKTIEERAEMRTSKMVEELSLSTDQAAKIREANTNQAAKMKAMREKQKAENESFREEARTLAAETEKQYQAILTPEQFEKYKQHKAQKMDENKARKRGDRNSGKNLKK